MNFAKYLVAAVLLSLVAGCSLAPQRPFTRQDIYKTNIFSYFTVKESPDAVLAQLNRDGEVVFEGIDKKNKSYFIKIVSNGNELKTSYSEK